MTTVALVAVGFALLGIALVPSVRAYGANDTWQTGFSGTGALGGGTTIGFWGWCTFAGVASGTDGDCQFSTYIHSAAGHNIQCQVGIDIAAWSAQAGGLTTVLHVPDFFASSATIHVRPVAQTGGCSVLLALEGIHNAIQGPGTLTVTSLSDLLIPAAPGHYSLNGIVFGGVAFQQLQFQVSKA